MITIARQTCAVDQVKLTVFPAARQTFAGLGVSEHNILLTYGQLTPTQRQTLARALWQDLNLKVFRLWLHDDPSVDLMYQDFVEHFVDSHLVEDALRHGVTELLLAPCGDPTNRAYAARFADVIQRLRDENGVRITTTGVANEPDDITVQGIVDAVKFFREELDKRGLDDVKLIAPERSTCDATAIAALDAIKQNPLAWPALAGVSTHSYHMAANNAIVSLIADSGKTYWITEAGDNGPEELHDTKRAVSMSARFLNDMNHLVTHWVWFLGAEDADPLDNSTRLIRYDYDPTSSPDAPWFEFLRKYYFLRQLSRTFDVGAVPRYTECDRALPTEDLGWTLGQLPALNVAMALNPDGTWGIGITNPTGIGRETDVAEAAWKEGQQCYPPTAYEVTLQVPELAATRNLDFRMERSNETLTEANQGIVHMKRGTLTLTLNAMDLVTLRSIK